MVALRERGAGTNFLDFASALQKQIFFFPMQYRGVVPCEVHALKTIVRIYLLHFF